MKQSRNGEFPSNYKASPIDFETQIFLRTQAPQKLSPSKRVFEKYKPRGLCSEFYGITITNLQIVLNTPKNPYFYQGTQTGKYLPKFSYPKNPEIENLKPQKIRRSSLSLEIRSTHPPHGHRKLLMSSSRPRAIMALKQTQSSWSVLT